MYLESTALHGQPCETEAPHGFFGIEQATVERIAEWIGAIAKQ